MSPDSVVSCVSRGRRWPPPFKRPLYLCILRSSSLLRGGYRCLNLTTKVHLEMTRIEPLCANAGSCITCHPSMSEDVGGEAALWGSRRPALNIQSGLHTASLGYTHAHVVPEIARSSSLTNNGFADFSSVLCTRSVISQPPSHARKKGIRNGLPRLPCSWARGHRDRYRNQVCCLPSRHLLEGRGGGNPSPSTPLILHRTGGRGQQS